MDKSTIGDRIEFDCPRCKVKVDGTDADTLMSTTLVGDRETDDLFRTMKERAPFDRANYSVEKACAHCGRQYMTIIRIGTAERVAYLCACGSATASEKIEAASTSPPQGV
ncbi:MAG: hypothetical protein M0R33_15230 [Methylomonas sp.]|jgi:lysyl-tRNA synthetase class I|uniref:hypothetical protein n=1 Tax=Methylomonas sp. TaxID=418 RepID=UPI0025D62418|nr:hypothetical protein [Methylomonas sp.]MCK9607794.1 hypothetical protein [Methylomonas sp.]